MNSRPPQAAEQTHQTLSLTEQATLSIESRLLELFRHTDSSEQIYLGRLPSMLESSPVALKYAIDDLGFFGENSGLHNIYHALTNDRVTNYPKKSQAQQRYFLNPSQVLELNRHVYTRSLSVRELAELLDVSIHMINQVVCETGVEPVRKIVGDDNGRGRTQQHHRYDADQASQIKAGLKQFDAPDGYIGETAILASTKIAPVALADITKRLGIEACQFHNSEIGQGENFFTEHDVLKVLLFIREHKRRHRQSDL